MKYFLLLILILGVVGAGYYFYNKEDATTPQKQEVAILVVPPQIPKNNVMVESTQLDKAGYLVVREVVGNRLGQIIEISSLLNPGLHKNVQISLGETDISNKELIVMIYEDQGDKSFNDLDMPFINSEGYVTASYVSTGKPLPVEITEGESSMAGHNMPGMQGMQRVRYTNNGFIPSSIRVASGTIVEFINESDTEMWVASNDHPGHEILSTFDQFKGSRKGSLYRYVFDKQGTWKYHDHLTPSLEGVVIVD